MKKILVVFLLVAMFCGASYYENHYTMTCRVAEATATGCLLVDEMGEAWYVEGEGFKVGEEFKGVFYTKLTHSNRLDDEIVKLK